MGYKLIFVRRSNSSFKVYAREKHKIRGSLISGEFVRHKLGSVYRQNVFVRFHNRAVRQYIYHAKFYNDSIGNFINFIFDARKPLFYLFFEIEKVRIKSF
jgi:hypothetical protein